MPNLAGPEYIPPEKPYLPCLFSVNCLMRWADLIHLRDRVHMPTFYSLLLMNPCDSNTFILHYMHFLMYPVTMTLHMPKHMRKYYISPSFCVLATVLYYLSTDYCVSCTLLDF